MFSFVTESVKTQLPKDIINNFYTMSIVKWSFSLTHNWPFVVSPSIISFLTHLSRSGLCGVAQGSAIYFDKLLNIFVGMYVFMCVRGGRELKWHIAD